LHEIADFCEDGDDIAACGLALASRHASAKPQAAIAGYFFLE
jgi:hypothetical protein